ncbi:MAG: PAS domain S-box protein [Clostridiales bacterium]|nr:PAS domain S-box protein [Clostridiales bacterium]
MRRRVAFAATLVSLALYIAFLAVTLRACHQTLVRASVQHLTTLCRASEVLLDGAAFRLEQGGLRSLADWLGVGAALLDEQGRVIEIAMTAGPIGADWSDNPEVAAAGRDGIGSDVRKGLTGDTAYAAMRLGGGGFVRLSAAAPTLRDAVAGNGWLLLGLTAVAGAMVYLLVRWSQRGMYQFTLRVTHLLEAFAEGRFGERLPEMPGEPRRETAQLNAVADRIDDQLLRQRRRNQAISAVMNQMQNGILAVDDQLRIILVTPVAKQLLGITGAPEGMPVMQASKDVHLDDVLQDAMRQDGVYTNEVLARTGSGRSHRPIRLYVSAMRQDGVAVGALALVEDITELRRLEQLRTDFAANVSHELKTPLTSIRGFVETLQAGAIENPERAQKFLGIIMLETERLTRLINDILTISKLESGNKDASFSRVRLDQLAYEVADMLRIHAAEKQVTVHAQQGDVPIYVWGNRDRVEQMLINLIENGIKYNKPGGSVSVSVYGTADTANLLVSDTGIGIEEEHLPRLFERFYRVDKGRSRSMGGTGLGLAIVKHLVRSMNGLIEVHSKLGEGTEFLVTLPRYVKEASNPTPAAEPAEDEGRE